MKKTCLLIVSLTTIFLTFTYVNASAAPEVELNYADWNPPQAQITKITVSMLERIEKNSQGRIKINAYLSASLLKQAEVYRGVQQGMADFAYFGPNIPGSPAKLGTVIALPFLGITNHAMAGRAYERLFRETPELQAEYKGVLVKGIFGIPLDNLHFKKKLVRVPADMKGMKTLTVGTRTEFVNELGGVPVMIDPGEWYMALDKGLAEGMYFLTPLISTFKLENQFRYHTLINGSATVVMFVFNEKKWKSIPPDLQQILDEAFQWRVMEMNKFHDEDEQTIYTNLKELGHEIYTPTSEELKLWENAAKPVQENWIESLEKKGLPGRKIFNALIHTIADVKPEFPQQCNEEMVITI